VRQWLESKSDEQLFRGSIGNNPSLADIIKMVHPRPGSAQREALYGYLLGQPYDFDALRELMKQFEAYKQAEDRFAFEQPDVPFQMLTSLDLAQWEWKAIARRAPWQTTRMNLNTFARNGVFKARMFKDGEMTRLIADRLRDPKQITRARALPHQLMVAHATANEQVPRGVHQALHDAMELALDNVPAIEGQVYVLPDVSGSMHWSLTGSRKGATSAVRCLDVAALIAAAILRKNPQAQVVPFHQDVERVKLNPRETVMTNADKLANLPSGGTDCSAPLRWLNRKRAKGEMVVFVSDNESWVETAHHGRRPGRDTTAVLEQWQRFKRRSPQAQLVCIDLQPYASTQAPDRADITNVGGFSDQVFELLADVAAGRNAAGYWVKRIEAVDL
jgi:60 kDa SS-A/Ro ribonucleoprotein